MPQMPPPPMAPVVGASPGETWAYRARGPDPLVAVRVVRFGTQRPARVLVRFVDDAFEGREEWVAPARLKVPWPDVDAFIDWERRWDAVADEPVYDTVEEHAASTVFDALIDADLARIGYGVLAGVTTIQNVGGLAAFLGVDPGVLLADPRSFEDHGALIVPWPTTCLIAERAAMRDPDRILRDVEADEAKARQEAVYGHDFRGYRGEWAHIEARKCALDDEEHGRPVREVLRRWCGADPVDRRDELAALRLEVVRLGEVVETAITALRRRGAAEDAAAIERTLGVRVARVNHRR